MRIGLVGCGNWGRHILRDLKSLGAEVEVTVQRDRSRDEAARGGADRIVDRIDALSALDGYVVATPTGTHAAVVQQLIPRGKPIFVEKPMTNDPDAARAIVAAAGERVFVMDKWRYHPGIEAIAAIAHGGELGKVLALRSYRLGLGNPPADADAIWQLLPHDLSIALEILGQLPAAASAFCPTPQRPASDFVCTLQDSGGPLVTAEIATNHPVTRRSVIVVGTRASAQLADSYAEGILVAESGLDGRFGAPLERATPGELPLLRELRAFLQHLQGGPPPRSSAADALAIVQRIAQLRRLAGLADEAQ